EEGRLGAFVLEEVERLDGLRLHWPIVEREDEFLRAQLELFIVLAAAEPRRFCGVDNNGALDAHGVGIVGTAIGKGRAHEQAGRYGSANENSTHSVNSPRYRRWNLAGSAALERAGSMNLPARLISERPSLMPRQRGSELND